MAKFLAGKDHITWEFQNLVVCVFYAEALFCALLRPSTSVCSLLRSFACFCVRPRFSGIIRDGPTATTTIFEFISRGPILHFWGTPGCHTKCPFYTVEHRENAKIFHLMCHQMLFSCGIRCKTFLEDYGCGCVWAVPDTKMTGVSKMSLLIFVAFARFLALTVKFWHVIDHRKRKGLTMNESKTAHLRSRNLKGLVFLSWCFSCWAFPWSFECFLLIFQDF